MPKGISGLHVQSTSLKRRREEERRHRRQEPRDTRASKEGGFLKKADPNLNYQIGGPEGPIILGSKFADGVLPVNARLYEGPIPGGEKTLETKVRLPLIETLVSSFKERFPGV